MTVEQLHQDVYNWRRWIEGGLADTVLTCEQKQFYYGELVVVEIGLSGATPEYAAQGARALLAELAGKVGVASGEGQ